MSEGKRSPIESGRYLRLRDGRADARNGSICALHLRVVCGVCPHFEGTLRGNAAPCGKLGLICRPDRDARSCEYWSRKGGGTS